MCERNATIQKILVSGFDYRFFLERELPDFFDRREKKNDTPIVKSCLKRTPKRIRILFSNWDKIHASFSETTFKTTNYFGLSKNSTFKNDLVHFFLVWEYIISSFLCQIFFQKIFWIKNKSALSLGKKNSVKWLKSRISI